MSIQSVEKVPEAENLPVRVKDGWCTPPKMVGITALVLLIAAAISVGIWFAVEGSDDDDDNDDNGPTPIPWSSWRSVFFSVQPVTLNLTIDAQNLPSTQCQPCFLECGTDCRWKCAGGSYPGSITLKDHLSKPFYSEVTCFCDHSNWRCTKGKYVSGQADQWYFQGLLDSEGSCKVRDCIYLGSEGLDHSWGCRSMFSGNFSALTTKSDNQSMFDSFQKSVKSVGATVSCSEAVAGRPYSSDSGSSLRSPLTECSASDGWVPSFTSSKPTPSNFTSEVIDAASSHWLDAAQDEHTSVASFSKFSIQLLAVAAPSDLVELAHKAALQEVDHAKICFKAAAMIQGEGSKVMGPGRFPAHSLEISSDVKDVAASTAREGAIGETNAALVAAVRYELYQKLRSERVIGDELSNHIEDSLKQIMLEEAEHAALAWKTLRWLQVDVDFDSIRPPRITTNEKTAIIDIKSLLLTQFGILSSSETAFLSSEVFEKVTLPLSKSIIVNNNNNDINNLNFDLQGSVLTQYGGDSVKETLRHILRSI